MLIYDQLLMLIYDQLLMLSTSVAPVNFVHAVSRACPCRVSSVSMPCLERVHALSRACPCRASSVSMPCLERVQAVSRVALVSCVCHSLFGATSCPVLFVLLSCSSTLTLGFCILSHYLICNNNYSDKGIYIAPDQSR